jgi:hypothetical protein
MLAMGPTVNGCLAGPPATMNLPLHDATLVRGGGGGTVGR